MSGEGASGKGPRAAPGPREAAAEAREGADPDATSDAPASARPATDPEPASEPPERAARPARPKRAAAPAGPDADAEPEGDRGPLYAALTIAAAGLGAWLALDFAASYALAASAGSFAVVYLVAERAHASWSSQKLSAPRARAQLARALVFGLAPALAAVLAGWASGGLRLRPSALGFGLALSALREGLEAARHETLARWLPWALARSRVPRAWLVGFQVLAGVAPLVGTAGPEAWALAAALGLLSAKLLGQSGLWAAPVAAHAALRITSAVLVPSLFELRWRAGSWSPLENARGAPALWLTAALGVAAAVLWAGARGGRVSATSRP
ncbi:MAG TPA: hypothetical protein VFS43_29075 [Polyangiaceae bacterium]|nr:hypothetical protein [Polyangiaceae bacterium]